MANMTALERLWDMMTSVMTVLMNISSLDRKMPRRNPKWMVLKFNSAIETKTRDGRANFPTKILSPAAASGLMILKVPVSQPRRIVTKIWDMVGSRSSRLTSSPDS